MIDAYVNEINVSLENKHYYSALSLALILPDICGSVEFPNKTVTERYIGWYDKYIGEYLKAEVEDAELRKPYLSGEMVYNLRNTFLHNGQPDIVSEKIKDADNQIQRFKLFVCNEMEFNEITLSGKIDDIPIKSISVDIRYLCRIISGCALWFYSNNIEKFNRDSEILICDSIDEVLIYTRKNMEDMCIENISKETGDKSAKYSFINPQITVLPPKRIRYERDKS